VAGHPGEHLQGTLPDLYARYGAHTPLELVSKFWAKATTPNGVLGLKFGLVEYRFATLLEAFREIDGHDGTRSGIWANVLPNGRHIFMTRRNKVRLAVSWWKAIQSREWHRLHGVLPQYSELAARYVPEAIDHLFSESVMREAAMQDFFAQARISPLTIVYEDFVTNYAETVSQVLTWIGLDPVAVTIAQPMYDRLADEVSEEWVQRFRQDKQAGWEKTVW